MRIFLPLLTLIIFLSAKSQVYHPILQDSVTWKFMTQGMAGPFFNSIKTIKDTTIGAHTYKKIAWDLPGTPYPFYLREDSITRKVYNITMGQDQLVYDFALTLHDSVYLHWVDGTMFNQPCPYNGFYVVDSVQMVNTPAGPRKFMRLVNGWYMQYWLEGLGSLNNYLDYPNTYCDMLDCGVLYTPYCQTRNQVPAYERSPMYSCDSGLVHSCTIALTHTHVDSEYVFTAHISSVGPYNYSWKLLLKDSAGNYAPIDSSTYPTAHFTISKNTEYVVNVTASDTVLFGCYTYSSLYIYDTLAPAGGNCNAFFWVYPDVAPGAYNAQNLSTGSTLSYTWDFGDGNSSTLPYPSHQYAGAGHYTICLTVSDNNGCTSTYCDSTFYNYKTGGGPMSSFNVTQVTGIEDAPGAYLLLYPNPVANNLTVTSTATLSGNPVVYNMSGQALQLPVTKNTNGFNINTQGLSAGVYYVSLNMGGQKLVRRFIKE